MSAHTCRCPATPAITEPSSEPMRCSCCGEPLVITCANACNPEHHAVPEPGRVPRPRGEDPHRANPAAGWKFAPKPCAFCRHSFTPTGGRAQICPDCKAKGIGLKDLPASVSVTP